MKKADQETLKLVNRSVILELIRKNKEISRIDLAEQTKLSPTTVSAITSELITKKLVTELRVGESNGGRRPVMMGLNPQAAYALAIRLTTNGATYALVDLSCSIVCIKECIGKIDSEAAAERVLQEIISTIKDKYPEYVEKIVGVGVSTPGVIDYENGIILYSASLHLKNFNISETIKNLLGTDAIIFKDADALALGEQHFGIGEGYKDFAYILVENGVGMAYVNSQKLFRLPYGGMELGHIVVDINGALCRCGNRGCLGTVISELPVLKRLNELIEGGMQTEMQNISSLKFKDIVNYSNQEDPAALMVLKEQAELIGVACANVINLFNPELVIVGGPLTGCSWDILDLVKDSTARRALRPYNSKVKVEFSKLGYKSSLLGLANEVFEKMIFKPTALI
ncbi:ROK family transcriptional regulator [Clostridium swellfunianum]|uniref:ROK family transcriptional regulator n=1 Tax=Clostridium swellfunianum TaxID=1367462 RepID=UPI002030F4D7|nr:ROK family transcriptional regulator [Clostridium swellfunianum]MCM0651041.1 ROK family transcriptional regulator [Clostridium swellfunianum]